MSIIERGLARRGKKNTRGTVNSYIENKLTTQWLTKKKTNRQITEHKTQHRNLKTKQHQPHHKQGVISGAPEGFHTEAVWLK